MDETTWLIVLALCAWSGQIALGFLQIRAFNRMLQSLAKQGQVKIGKTRSRWKPRTIVVLVEDEYKRIIDAKVMRGVTIFARPKSLPDLIGLTSPIKDEQVKHLDKQLQEAISVAFSK
ncbi:transcriptional regulator GutM [Vibrio metschnikovii]|uniref:transcriptional regulator GutM n=1 Tax=Vibrio sp. V33_P6A3T137 TaxID=1938685 RepID=UPI00137344CD|nr:transcriptional regulator GutM [Vibrio sp. V33_P6A3T137]EKO3605556.1 transcriptional regulator GutM [Vibrio metschnikovii]EKO3610091.1 transcriptional regulator GutM [Vibrio metschnikovii]EKO3639289.1 transcriptional regulator GutM [Vibrio metschnikovii]EKO3683059.1 transcriptional regulator GutM [Vibrio metschnikovii]EKO3700084.1 transcriptional regulator GutM [Vibrio metschnikovii]